MLRQLLLQHLCLFPGKLASRNTVDKDLPVCELILMLIHKLKDIEKGRSLHIIKTFQMRGVLDDIDR